MPKNIKNLLLGIAMVVAGALALFFGAPELGNKLIGQGEATITAPVSPTTVQ